MNIFTSLQINQSINNKTFQPDLPWHAPGSVRHNKGREKGAGRERARERARVSCSSVSFQQPHTALMPLRLEVHQSLSPCTNRES